MAKLNGFSSLSLLAIESVACLVPEVVGINSIWNVVVELPEIVAEGIAVTLKSEEAAPLILTYGDIPVKFRSKFPEFPISKVRVTEPTPTLVEPKSV